MDELDDLEESGPEPYWVRAGRIAEDLREIADVIEDNPELAKLPDPYDAAQQLLSDLHMLDGGTDLDVL
jgi:hypothetical protein